MLPVPILLALRYLRPRRTFVSVITVISITGVTLGVMVLVLVIAVMSGFDRELRQKVMGLNSHLTIGTGSSMSHWQKTAKLVGSRPHIKGVSPFVLGPVMIKFNGRIFTPYLKGIDPKTEGNVSQLPHFLKHGQWSLSGEKVIIGYEMARRYGIFLGDKITLYSPRNLENTKVAYLPAEPEVVGIFESGMFEYDYSFIFCSLEMAQDLFDMAGKVHGIAVMTDQLERIPNVQKDLNHSLEPPLRASTWMELNRRLFSAIAVEKNVMFFILIFIIIVAAFGIMSTLITVTVQKQREIGILKSLGATPANILSIFIFQGMVVGVFGTILGLGAGLLLLAYRNEFLALLRRLTHFELFPREIYYFDQLPSQINAHDLWIIGLSAIFICTLAGLLPAWRAAKLQPATAIRGE